MRWTIAEHPQSEAGRQNRTPDVCFHPSRAEMPSFRSHGIVKPTGVPVTLAMDRLSTFGYRAFHDQDHEAALSFYGFPMADGSLRTMRPADGRPAGPEDPDQSGGGRADTSDPYPPHKKIPRHPN